MCLSTDPTSTSAAHNKIKYTSLPTWTGVIRILFELSDSLFCIHYQRGTFAITGTGQIYTRSSGTWGETPVPSAFEPLPGWKHSFSAVEKLAQFESSMNWWTSTWAQSRYTCSSSLLDQSDNINPASLYSVIDGTRITRTRLWNRSCFVLGDEEADRLESKSLPSDERKFESTESSDLHLSASIKWSI